MKIGKLSKTCRPILSRDEMLLLIAGLGWMISESVQPADGSVETLKTRLEGIMG